MPTEITVRLHINLQTILPCRPSVFCEQSQSLSIRAMDGFNFMICFPTEAEEKEMLSKTQSSQASTPLRAPDYKTNKESTNIIQSLQSAALEESISSKEDLLRVDGETTQTNTPAINLPSRTEGFFSSFRKSTMRRKRTQAVKMKSTNWATLDIPLNSPMETVVRELLQRAKIENATWTKLVGGQKIQVTFTVEIGQKCDRIKQTLLEWGIGTREGSTFSLMPCYFFNASATTPATDSDDAVEDDMQKEGAWERFVSSMTARFNVAQLVEEVRYNAELRFDFVSLIVIASILAGFGLVEDNPLFLAASMLISPLMGPIIAATFGTVIKNRKLQRLGIVNELLGILMATLVGFVFGMIICSVDSRYGLGEGLTQEMLSRCELHSLLVGILIALPSGAAVAIGILGENMGSLAGVAISASLLPPAVNSGLMWALACLYKIYEADGERYNSIIKTNYYSNHQSIEVAIMGSISMCVTITNVISVYLMGVIFLRIKEVAPIATQNYRNFWKHDVKIARDYNKTCQAADTTLLRQKLAEEIAGFEAQTDNRGQGVRAEIVRRLTQGPMASLYYHQHTWSPLTHAPHNRPTVQEIESLLLKNNQHASKYISHLCSPPRSNPRQQIPRRPECIYGRRCSMPSSSVSSYPKANIAKFLHDERLDSIAETPGRSSNNSSERGKSFIVVPVEK
ncbi:uncharacterized protein LOC132264481 [Phlebotomus argentipes]|uniref:uncharacterized protein LOC132264481 n=1 Tax=Phlebotomus argentipes TaxID=94469 RepID=UPI0028932ACA|nr:uncharacterized protein LOC132264481 [Phlebotomus argentipes]